MTLQARIDAFSKLGSFLKNQDNQLDINNWADRAINQNNWFTLDNTKKSLKAIADFFLNQDLLEQWAGLYDIQDKPLQVKTIGVIMAGNIPAVGFHDLLTVLMSGHACAVKVSSQDGVLMLAIIETLLAIEPRFDIRITEKMNEVDALIATGSDNSARYFEYYFRNKPHVIRQNRSSVAILSGEESADDFMNLGKDITDYYGLGCRNVSKMYVPEGYDFTPFYDTIEPLGDIFYHNKYKNNYDYNKSIYLVNQVTHLDNGFLIVTPNEALVSPISVIFYETYASQIELREKIEAKKAKIQCVVSKNAWFEGSVAFGDSQKPKLWDYADGVDTMLFLLEL